MTTTFPQLLLKHATERPDAPALREKEYGIWQTWSWREAAQTVRHMACGLRALGLESGQNLAFISFRPVAQCPFRCTRMPWPPRCAL